jgi:hypothetical protein
MSDGGGPGKAPTATDNQTTSKDTAPAASWYDLSVDVGPNLHDLRLDTASQAIIDLGRHIDSRNAQRERNARTLAELASECHRRGTLDSRIAGALRLVGAALEVSSERLRQAVADAIDGDGAA